MRPSYPPSRMVATSWTPAWQAPTTSTSGAVTTSELLRCDGDHDAVQVRRQRHLAGQPAVREEVRQRALEHLDLVVGGAADAPGPRLADIDVAGGAVQLAAA